MLSNPECDVYSLLDEAYALSLTVHIDLERARRLADQLRSCAEAAREAGLGELQRQLLREAEELEKRSGGESAA